ncbi:MAG TPA: MBL fold metallo-hydrolase [Herpetosiphonaceae bacterium]
MAGTSLELRTVTVGDWKENCYILRDAAAKEAIVVDPGAEAERILAALDGAAVAHILITHAHGDHVGAVEAVRAATGAPVWIHPAELPALAPISHDRELADGLELDWAGHRIRAVRTPGHTPGMISLIVDETHALVGDTIFAGGPGRTWSADDFVTTLATLRSTILSWPDHYQCHPGHGPSFELGAVRPAIAAFAGREHPAGFHGDAEW